MERSSQQPRNLGQYILIEQIGRGGMATVFKAFQPSLDRHVAIKILSAHYAADPDFTERFRREAKSVARLRHPNILTLHDYGEEDGTAYIVMEFVDGGTLKCLLGKPLSLERTLSIVSQIASALSYAHQQGMIHRDVKPANILIAEDGRAVLSDFGIAKMMEATAQLTAAGVGIGTPEYMSPEQGLGKAIDHRSDIYSLGVVLYEMLTGHKPFSADTPYAVIYSHVHEPLPIPHELNPNLPTSVERVILKALAKEPADRFQTADELSQALTVAINAAASQAEDPTKPLSPEQTANLYGQARAAEAAGRKAEALDLLTRIQELSPGYRDVPDLLQTIQTFPATQPFDEGRQGAAAGGKTARKAALPTWTYGAIAALALALAGGTGYGFLANNTSSVLKSTPTSLSVSSVHPGSQATSTAPIEKASPPTSSQKLKTPPPTFVSEVASTSTPMTVEASPTPRVDPTKPPQAAPVTKILSATTCKAVDSEKKPIDPIAVFHPNDTIYASAELEDFPKGAEATGNWYFGDQFVDGATVTSSDDYSTAWVSFDLAPTQAFPVGEYRLEIKLGDSVAKTVLFNIEDQPGQAEQTSGLKNYTSSGLSFQMGYPKDWTTKEDETSVTFSSPEPSVLLFVYAEQASSSDTIGGLNGSFIDAAKADYPDLTVLGNQSLDFAGENWLETDFYYTDESGTQQAWVDIVALRQGVAYFIVLMAPLDTFEQTRQASFLPMLESFKFS